MTAVPPPPPPGPPDPSTLVTMGNPPPTAPLDDRLRELDPLVKLVWRLSLAITFTAVVFAVTIAILVFDAPWWLTLIVAGAACVVVAWYPSARYRHWRWRLGDLALELSYGVFVQRHEAVPYFRIQQIDIARGPIDRLLGLSTLHVTSASASGSAVLPAIAASDAPRIRHELLQRASQALAESGSEGRDAV
ncbi:MAG: PH domain-containing protein [Nitriliruptoraceae bacterium]